MADFDPNELDLSVLAPARIHGEAISSWLIRIAAAHLLTASELAEQIGFDLSSIDRGNMGMTSRLARMLDTDERVIRRAVSVDLISNPLRAGPAPPFSWAVCPRCLERDREEGSTPHIRAWWTHPLATACLEHRTHVVPHFSSAIEVADSDTLFGGDPPEGRPDTSLEAADFDDWRILKRVHSAHTRARSGSFSELLRLRFATRDVVDALATQRTSPSRTALMNAFEGRFFQRRSSVGVLRMPENWWADIDAVTRLLYVRTALFILSEPADPVDGRSTALGKDWLVAGHSHSKVDGWQSLYGHAVLDPLFILSTQLPRHAVLELHERSVLWPRDLRKRWTYAAAVGAVGGYVF